jgi:CTP:phosphocholine cytidylyltransferase-like protein
MIRQFKIKAQKDENGYYIVPDDVLHKSDMIDNLRYHQNTMKPVQNLMFAIICVINQDKKRDTDVNGWTWNYVRINNVRLDFDTFFLDEEENVIYEMDNKDELPILKRKLKLKKLKK